jgi:hypothetical protein
MDDRLQRRQNALSVASETSLTASSQMLGLQMHLTALNAKSEPEAELVSEFDRVFSKEPPEAIQWAFGVWREKSPFFPAIANVRSLVNEWRRGQREQAALRAQLDEKFLLEEGRKRGDVLDFGETVKLLKQVADDAKPDSAERERQFKHRMLRAALALPTIQLTEEQIRERREGERREIARYAEHSDNEFS